MGTTRTTPIVSLVALHAGLAGRPWPEAVAGAIRSLLAEDLSKKELRLLDRAAQAGFGYSYLANTFDPVVPIARPAQVLAELIGAPAPVHGASSDGAAIPALLESARAYLGMTEGRTSFKHDRANRADRGARGLDISRRRYDKLFRLVARLEADLLAGEEQAVLFRLNRFAKTAFAADLPYESFAASTASAAFVAWYAANLGRRSLFIAGPQARAFDEVAAMLFARCERAADTDWLAIAHVFPRADVLARLTLDERVELLGRVLAVLEETAARLEVIAVRDHLDLERMIVRKGNDSSTWNGLAGAWNRARDSWIALIYALDHEVFFDAFLPGKVLRLMAADVAAWHRLTGKTVHDDTSVWAALPKPWDVVAGRTSCGRADVEGACRRFGIDPEKTGWTAPRPRTAVDVWRATPETVHGVVVNHPELALFLRKVGVFSGKSLRLQPVD
jgi:hypothetical protein